MFDAETHIFWSAYNLQLLLYKQDIFQAKYLYPVPSISTINNRNSSSYLNYLSIKKIKIRTRQNWLRLEWKIKCLTSDKCYWIFYINIFYR